MVDKKHLRRSRSQGYFHRNRPGDIYIKNPHALPYLSREELILTSDLLFDGEQKENMKFSVQTSDTHSAIRSSSPRNFFLEKPPANWKSEETPISPGVTVLLSPASLLDGDGADLEVMEFFQTATYSGPRTFAEKTRMAPRYRNTNKKRSSSKIGLPSPKTPKAWPSIVDPDLSTLPSQEVVERNVLDARLKLARQVTSNETSLGSGNSGRPRLDNPLEAYFVAPGPMPGRKQTRSPPPDIKQTKRSSKRGQSESPPINDRRRLVESQHSLSPNIQKTRSPSNEANSLKKTHRKRIMLEPTSTISGHVPRTPSPVFDFDDSEITDIESDTEFDEACEERLSRCETLSSQEPYSPIFNTPPKPLEKDWKFRLQQDCAMGTLGTLESPSMFSSASQAPLGISKSTNRNFEQSGLRSYNTIYTKSSTKREHTDRPRHGGETSTRAPISHIVPPPRRKSPPPIMAPIHRDQVAAKGASFEPESRTPRTLVSNWLASISSNAGRKEQPRDHDIFWKKTRSWGRKTKPKLEGWI
ncbi:hypothetical protein NHQ30_004572 [Ciborinia camelliae]|nr:hypothetical protein NHQ30_004572 [Ciborinia camelliae]